MKQLVAILALLASRVCAGAEAGPVPGVAATLLNVARFIYWPAGAAGAEECLLCFRGDESVAAQLSILDGGRLHGRTVRLRRILAPADALRCQIFFLSGAAADLDRYIDAVSLRPVLTVGLEPRFLASGGNVAILRDEQGLRLAVNLASTQRNGLRVNAQLMRVATAASTDGRR